MTLLTSDWTFVAADHVKIMSTGSCCEPRSTPQRGRRANVEVVQLHQLWHHVSFTMWEEKIHRYNMFVCLRNLWIQILQITTFYTSNTPPPHPTHTYIHRLCLYLMRPRSDAAVLSLQELCVMLPQVTESQHTWTKTRKPARSHAKEASVTTAHLCPRPFP